MSTGKIDKRAVDAIQPGDRDRYLWDETLKGFGLKVTPAGRKVYLVQYRMRGGGRTRRVTIGRHGSPWTSDQARGEATRILGDVATGVDPAEARSRHSSGITVAELCDLYLAEGVATKRASTVAMDRSRIERHVKPLLGSTRVSEIRRADVERMMRDIANGKTAADRKTKPRGRSRVTGGEGAASRTVGMLGGIFAFAIGRGLRTDNPARSIKRYKERKRERYLSALELARLGTALAAAEAVGENPAAIAAIRLLALTGCRKAEILTLRWEYVDWERSRLALPDSRRGAKSVRLGAPALELLRTLPRREGNPFVIPGSKPGDHFKGLQKIWAGLREKAEIVVINETG